MPPLPGLPLVFWPILCVSAAGQTGLWAQLAFPASPSARFGASLVHDSARDRLVLVGGASGFSSIAQTWENDGSQWILRGNSGPSGVPGSGYSMQAVYDSQRQRTVAVKGDGPSNETQTWEWDGAVWQQRSSAQTPAGRFDFALAYDSVRGRTVLFGGRSGLYGVHSDTWEWDGTNWVQRSSGGPPPRRSHAMTFDAARGVTVLFGGHRDISGYNAQLGDTWEWNGSYWVEHFGVAGPAPRSEHRMTYDAPRQRTVLCGGRAIYGGGASYTDTWEWNGSAWTNMQAVAPVSSHAALAFDAARQRTVLFGGKTDGGVESNGTWAYSAQNGPFASIVPYGSGCAGPTGVPLLAVLPGSLPRLGATLALEVSNLPTGLLNVPVGWLGFDDATWGGAPLPLALDGFGFPGCVALLAPSTEYSLTNVAGTASWSIPIPFLPSYAGLQFYLQAGVLVLGFNPGGLVFSRALHGTVGI